MNDHLDVRTSGDVRSSFSSRFAVNDHVLIDGDPSLKAVVVGFYFKGNGLEYVDCAWFANGVQQCCTFEAWRVSRA